MNKIDINQPQVISQASKLKLLISHEDAALKCSFWLVPVLHIF